jgi:hypothetical protein
MITMTTVAPPKDAAERARQSPTGNRTMLAGTAAVAAASVALGVVGTLWVRGWGEVPVSVPSAPWYHSTPFYLFWQPGLRLGWAAVALPVAALAAAAVVALAVAPPLARLPRAVRLAGSFAAAFVLALAVATLAGGPDAWGAPLAYDGEYPGTVPLVPSIPDLLQYARLHPVLPDFPAQHPPGATLFYVLVDRVWPGLTGAALASVAAACLGVLVVAGLARDQLGEDGERIAVACWALAPLTILYAATSADAMWAPLLAGGALAAHRGLWRRSWAWTVAGGVLLWAASMMTFAAVLVLAFLAVRALARWRSDRAWVLRWAVGTTVVVLALAGGLYLAVGYSPLEAVRLVESFWSGAPGQRDWRLWLPFDLLAFLGMLGFPLTAAILARLRGVARERAFTSFEAATVAMLVAGAAWGHTKGEVERMWQFMVPFAVVVAAAQLRRWRVSLPLVGALLVAQAVAVQVLFFTRW